MDYIFSEKDAQLIIEQYQLKESETLKERLRAGIESDLQIIHLGNQQYRKGKVKITKDNLGNPHVAFNYHAEVLVIPKRILNKELTEDEQKSLKDGKLLVKQINKNWVGIQIDPELNKITLRSEKELGVIKEINGYKLTEKEQAQLLKHGTLTTQVFHDKKRDIYYSASIELSEDRRDIKFVNPQELSKEEALELREQIDRNKPNLLSSISDTVIIEDEKDIKNIINSISDSNIEEEQDKNQTSEKNEDTPEIQDVDQEDEIIQNQDNIQDEQIGTTTEIPDIQDIAEDDIPEDLLNSSESNIDNDLKNIILWGKEEMTPEQQSIISNLSITNEQFQTLLDHPEYQKLPIGTQTAIPILLKKEDYLKEQGKDINKQSKIAPLQHSKSKSINR